MPIVVPRPKAAGFGDEWIEQSTWADILRVRSQSNIVQVLEPEKCTGWEWHSFAELRAIASDDMPLRELFLPLTNLINTQPTFDPATAFAALPKPEGWDQTWIQTR